MKPRASNNRNAGLTLTEVLVVLAILGLFAVMLLPAITNRHNGIQKINCVNSLKEVYIGSIIWAGDHNDKFPMQISVTNGGTMEFAQRGEVLGTFQIMSNQLGTPKILYCTEDSDHVCAQNFSSDFSVRNISYFIGLGVDRSDPHSIFAGDDNFEISNIPVEPGLLVVAKNVDIGWTSTRHKFNMINEGNIVFADGSVEQTTSSSLAANFTNNITRLAIP